MTRINIIEPSELTDQHLIAEYREIFMVGSVLQRSLKSKNWDKTKKNLPKVKIYRTERYLHLAVTDTHGAVRGSALCRHC